MTTGDRGLQNTAEKLHVGLSGWDNVHKSCARQSQSKSPQGEKGWARNHTPSRGTLAIP